MREDPRYQAWHFAIPSLAGIVIEGQIWDVVGAKVTTDGIILKVDGTMTYAGTASDALTYSLEIDAKGKFTKQVVTGGGAGAEIGKKIVVAIGNEAAASRGLDPGAP